MNRAIQSWRDFCSIPSESTFWNIERPNPEVARIGIGSKVKFVPAFNATPAGTVAYLIFQAGEQFPGVFKALLLIPNHLRQ